MMRNSLNIDRRALLGAAPVIAAAAAVPPLAALNASNLSAGWEQAKALYTSATADAATTYKRYDDAYTAYKAARPAEPAALTIRYTEPGFDTGRVLLRPYETSRTVEAREALKAPPTGLEDHPDSLGYQKEVVAWDRECEECSQRFKVDALEKEWDRFEAQRFEVWKAMVTYPVTTLAELADKLAVASDYADVPEDEGALLKGLAADVRRLAGVA